MVRPRVGTLTTFRVIGQGVFQDTLTTLNVVNSAVCLTDSGDQFDSGSAAGTDGCVPGAEDPPSQSCVAHTEMSRRVGDGGTETKPRPSLRSSGVASVSFECAGVPGPFEITAMVGTVVSNTIVR